jgi:hypothetical protein
VGGRMSAGLRSLRRIRPCRGRVSANRKPYPAHGKSRIRRRALGRTPSTKGRAAPRTVHRPRPARCTRCRRHPHAIAPASHARSAQRTALSPSHGTNPLTYVGATHEPDPLHVRPGRHGGAWRSGPHGSPTADHVAQCSNTHTRPPAHDAKHGEPMLAERSTHRPSELHSAPRSHGVAASHASPIGAAAAHRPSRLQTRCADSHSPSDRQSDPTPGSA